MEIEKRLSPLAANVSANSAIEIWITMVRLPVMLTC